MLQQTRRRFFQQFGALLVAAKAPLRGFAAPLPDSMVLLGTQTGAGIYRARWNARTGQLGTPELAIASTRPTFLALHGTLPIVYAGNEGDGPAATVSAFAVERTTATLSALGTQPTHGSSPCFVSVDRSGQLLFAANYGGGSLATFPLDAQGVPGSAELFSCSQSGLCGTPGPVHDRQDGPHLHCAVLSPDNQFVLACDLGDDAILAFPLHPGQQPGLGMPQRLPARVGSGPRHLAFHPNGQWLYCIHELDCTVDRYIWRSSKGVAEAQLVPHDVVRLAGPSTTSTPNTAAEIAISRNGQFLYTCTRGIDILTVFRIDPATGSLRQVQQLPCGGQSPRFFALDPTEQWLLCTNQVSESITVFARNTATGQLAPHATIPMPSPMCVVWL
ncbi:MAG: lactonase family protein [Janthinobacterium lividum]